MTDSSDYQLIEPQLRRVMRDCRKLYASAARLMSSRHPTLLGPSAEGFAELMEDLHRGLLIKVYTQTIRSDGRWSRMEKQIGAVMIQHIWDEDLRGAPLREAAEGLLARSDQLSWGSLLAPFVRYEPLRDMVSQIETIVSRLANLIAKCDGLTTPEETIALHEIQFEVGKAPRKVGGSNPGLQAPETRNTDFLHSPAEKNVSTTVPAKRPAKSTSVQANSPTQAANDEKRLADAIAELDSLVGLETVKQRVRSLSNFLRLQRTRSQAGLATMPISLHMSFVGNPGTGKTTVARIVGQILGAMGVLERGHLVETDRSGLVAEYAGQSAPKTNAICQSALGGVLFIDEAYSLVDSSGEDVFGREAIQTLLKRMEDDRDRLVVIVAGYPNEMDQMIRSNPGLSSRINTRIEFEDYSPADLGRIFETLCKRNDYRLPPESRHRLLVAFDEAYRKRDRHFGNGRLARNAFEDCVRRLADRIASVFPLTDDLMTCLTPQDITMAGAAPERIDGLLNTPHTLRTHCPHCKKRVRIRGSSLGRTLKCPGCLNEFAAPWADIELSDSSK
ncbi:MAG TPA: AAA family ATPase [Planctomycetaceae bacterium]|nr:AAA family ATPase [Planctomycetaceae bacterium]